MPDIHGKKHICEKLDPSDPVQAEAIKHIDRLERHVVDKTLREVFLIKNFPDAHAAVEAEFTT